jgi:pimeloyl-ACP methyl ester carboxylesterase
VQDCLLRRPPCSVAVLDDGPPPLQVTGHAGGYTVAVSLAQNCGTFHWPRAETRRVASYHIRNHHDSSTHPYPAPAGCQPTLLPPLVFVHGGYATARCWDEYFLPYFNHRGFDCHALDLSGHGESEGHERLDSFGIDDYVEDLTQVARQLPAPAVFIGHSMSTVVVERFLEQNTARAAILMAPVPPGGILGASMKMALTQPAFFSEQLRPAGGEQSAQTMRSVYYSRETEIDDLMRFAGFFQSESRRAILDLSLLAMRIGRRRPALPVLVVAQWERSCNLRPYKPRLMFPSLFCPPAISIIRPNRPRRNFPWRNRGLISTCKNNGR